MLRIGQVLEITFPSFTPRITFRSERELTVEIVAGENTGFADTVEYKMVVVRDGLVVLSWQEHIGSTIVHVLDLIGNEAYTFVRPARGGFMRLNGRISLNLQPNRMVQERQRFGCRCELCRGRSWNSSFGNEFHSGAAGTGHSTHSGL